MIVHHNRVKPYIDRNLDPEPNPEHSNLGPADEQFPQIDYSSSDELPDSHQVATPAPPHKRALWILKYIALQWTAFTVCPSEYAFRI